MKRASNREAGPNSLKKKKIKKYESKTNILKPKNKRNRTTLKIICPICFEDFRTQPVSATICGHIFCTCCLMKAKSMKSCCPVCRTILRGTKAHHPLYLENCLYFE